MDVSVIIVNWNTKDLLLSCVRSLKANTRKATFEIIVVDNASIDGSQDALKSRFPDVKLIQNDENFGFAKANNIGIRASTGRYLCLVNSDVEVKSGCIDKMISHMDHHPLTGILGPKIYLPDGKVQLSCKNFPSLWRQFCSAILLHRIFYGIKIFEGEEMTSFYYDKIYNVDVLIGAFWMVRQKAVEDVGLLDEAFFFYSEDVDWCKRFSEKGWVVNFFPDAEIVHYTGGSSQDAPVKYYIQQRQAKLQYWAKYHGRLSLVIVKIIMLIHAITRMLLESVLYILRPSNRGIIELKIKRSVACFLWLLKNETININP